MSLRQDVLAQIVSEIRALQPKPIARVAVDGVDGAGKTCFADELKALLGDMAIRASIDSFHHPRAIRYAPGKQSPQGFYDWSFNYQKVTDLLLDPLSAVPPQRYCSAFFDHQTDSEVPLDWRVPPEQSILLFDGIFSHRPELAGYWDYSIFLEVSPLVSVKRCIEREGVTGVSYDPSDAVHARYVEGQAIYLAACRPSEKCTRRILNEDIDAPVIIG